MDAVASKLGCRHNRRADSSRLGFFGEKNGKYPDGNQVHQQSSDRVGPRRAPRRPTTDGPELDAAELVVMGHVHEDHMAVATPSAPTV